MLISSVVAETGNLGQMNYTAAKAGVVGLVRTGALELARFGTTVNGVRPGFIETPMTAAMPAEAQGRLTENPLGRAGQPDDIAGAVAYLCSEDAAFVTGHLIDVNGGAQFNCSLALGALADVVVALRETKARFAHRSVDDRRRALLLAARYMSMPPLTPQIWPVMYDDASAARKCTIRATSSGRPRRRIGICALILSSTFSGTAATISVIV